MSNTENVKLGVCKVFFDGVDLGYTKGGVDVEVATETKKVEVDQFGKTPINEIIMGRTVQVKVPMAETTLENMVRIMPGASLHQTGGAKASGTITVATPVADDTVVVAGVTFTFKSSGASGGYQVTIGGSAAATAQNLYNKLIAATDDELVALNFSIASAVITVTADDFGVAGNAVTLAKTGTGITLSGATLSGGLAATKVYVDVPTSVGFSLLETAKSLRLHPKSNADNDKSEDFVIPLAQTAGGLTFAYNFENERVFNVTFMGYPDPASELLFRVGDDTP